MRWKIIVQVVIILCGLFVGAYFSKVAYAAHEKLGHSDLEAHKEMDHGSIDIYNDEIIPEITDVAVLKDPMSGWNIYVQVDNFRFAPERASQPHRPGEGHAHLYLNGKKVARMYSNWYHIPELIRDQNEIKITLNSNDHRTFTIGSQVIEKIILQ